MRRPSVCTAILPNTSSPRGRFSTCSMAPLRKMLAPLRRSASALQSQSPPRPLVRTLTCSPRESALCEIRSPLHPPEGLCLALGVPVGGTPHSLAASDAALGPSLLVRRVACAVRWRKGVEVMVAASVTTFSEGRSGRMATGLVERVHKGSRAFAVSDRASLDGTVAVWIRHGREAADV
jgi:hypothetical protein